MRLSCCAPLTYDSTPPIKPSWNSRSFKAARRRKLSSDGSAAIASATTSGGLQELERFFEALPDHLRIVSSAYGRACMSGYRDRQNAERLCVAAQS